MTGSRKSSRSLAVSAALALLFVVTGLVLTQIQYSHFEKLDLEDIEYQTKQVQRALVDRQVEFSKKTSDWGAWNEAFNYVVADGKNKTFINDNFTYPVFSGMNVTAVAYYKQDKTLLDGSYIPAGSDQLKPIDSKQMRDVVNEVSSKKSIVNSGYMKFDNSPAIFTSSAVTDSNRKLNSGGFVVFVFKIDEDFIKRLSDQTLQNLKIHPSTSSPESIVSSSMDILPQDQKEMPIERIGDVDGASIYGYGNNASALIPVVDFNKDTAAYIHLSLERKFKKSGSQTLAKFGILYIMLATLVFLLFIAAVKGKRLEAINGYYKEENQNIVAKRNSLSALVDSIPGYVSWFDHNLTYLGVNRKLASDFNLHPDVFIGKGIGWMNLDKETAFTDAIRAFKSDSLIVERMVEVPVEINERKRYLLSMQKYGVPENIVVVGIDITQSWRLEEQSKSHRKIAIQASRLSALGKLAGGIAHEINNPMAIIQGAVENIRREYRSGAPPHIEKMFSILSNTILRVNAIVNSLQLLAKDSKNDKLCPVSLCRVIDYALSFFKETCKSTGIQVYYTAPSSDIIVEALESQLTQVLICLLNNSVDAIKLNENSWIKVEVWEVNSNVVEISVTDSGRGIPNTIADQILDPFFSTKPIGKGMGLGLSLSAHALTAFEGQLTYDQSCENTRFLVILKKTLTKSLPDSLTA